MAFLNKKQITKLEQVEWDVIPECAYVKIHRDELSSIEVWGELCDTLHANRDATYIRILAIASSTSV